MKGEKYQERAGNVPENARRYATFIKVKVPEGAGEMGEAHPSLCAQASEQMRCRGSENVTQHHLHHRKKYVNHYSPRHRNTTLWGFEVGREPA